MEIKRIILSVVSLALVTMVVSSVYVAYACRPGLSPGYWKHNVKVYCGGPGEYSGEPKETNQSMENYESIIQGWGYPWFTLEWANERFQNNTYKDLWLDLANGFNRAAGRLPYSEPPLEQGYSESSLEQVTSVGHFPLISLTSSWFAWLAWLYPT